VEVPMVFDAQTWQILSNANTKWDPFDLIGRIFDGVVRVVADAVAAEESEPPEFRDLAG